jgi:hypothetical protein
MWSALFWDITQSGVVTPYRCFGTSLPHHHGCKTWGWDRRVGLIDCSEMSVRNYLCMLRNIREEHRSQVASKFLWGDFANFFGIPYFFIFVILFSFYHLILGMEGCCCIWHLITINATHAHTYIYTHTNTYSAGLLWKSDQHVAQTSTRQEPTLTTDIHVPVLESAIPASERPNTHASDRAVTGIFTNLTTHFCEIHNASNYLGGNSSLMKFKLNTEFFLFPTNNRKS